MIVKKIYPRLLHEEIDYIYVFKSDGVNKFESHMHLPDGAFKLLFHFGESILKKEKYQYTELPNTRVVGGYTNSFHLRYPLHFCIFVVVFKPGFITNYLPDLIDISVDKNVPADLIFGNEIAEMTERISSTKDLKNAILNIEAFLYNRRVDRTNYHTGRINASLKLIENRTLSMSDICREIGMSERNFRRVFKQSTGFTPQKMMQLRRVKALSKLLDHRTPLNSILEKFGYYDVPHLINDFKSVTDATPKQYVGMLDDIDVAFRKPQQID